jgi:aconitate hydratase
MSKTKGNKSSNHVIPVYRNVQPQYEEFVSRINSIRKLFGRPLTLTEKILYAHLYDEESIREYKRGEDYVNFAPDRIAMQDATAQMALLQFMNAGRERTAVPSSVHCDHLIQAYKGAGPDMESALYANREVYDFLESVSDKYGIDFWKPGAGIIHQVVLENYAFPGGMMLGTDSHTPNAGGLGMIAVGVGGADAVDAMTAMPWELKMPEIIGVRLTGRMNGWTSPKDVILKLAGILTVKGATNSIIEYFGPGAETVSATGKATICNMGAEVGATTSVFPFDSEMKRYLEATGRRETVKLAENIESCLKADREVLDEPEKYYDRVIDIDLSALEPYINGPFTPDAATPISAFAQKVRCNGYPETVDVGLIGSCTNSSYQDLDRTASIARQAIEKELPVKAKLIINPGSEQIRHTADRDGITEIFESAGGVIMANACGPCIGQWKRITDDNGRPNSIVTSFNRNFAKRTDGNPNTHNFVASPEIAMAMTIAGRLTFNPLTDRLQNRNGDWVLLNPPTGKDLPPKGFESSGDRGCTLPRNITEEVVISPASDRLQRLKPFEPWDGKDLADMPLLIKVKGKCTTDHISMAGPWLRFRGHLENISDNLLMGAVNAFGGKTNSTLNLLDGSYKEVSAVAKDYKAQGLSSIVVAEDNYGEGSSREHAAMEPRFLHVRVILARTFARIHETNLKKQGMLALTFARPGDYDRVREDDRISITGLDAFSPHAPLKVTLKHSDGSSESFEALHSYNEMQIEWFRAGSALNYNRKKQQ